MYCHHVLQVVNYNHMMPTRYTLDVDLKGVVSGEVVDDSSKKTDANKVRRRNTRPLTALGRATSAHAACVVDVTQLLSLTWGQAWG
jgi:hypothetical protein